MHTATPIASFDELDLPPGFGDSVIRHMKASIQAFSDIVAETPWRCPDKYVLNPSWQVVAGEESLDVSTQQQRELGVLEAVYPRITSIPESPAEPQGPQQPYDDSLVSQIPVVPIEEDDSMDVDDNGDSNTDGDSQEPVLKGGQVANNMTLQKLDDLRAEADKISKDKMASLAEVNLVSGVRTPFGVPNTSDLPCLTEQSGGNLSQQQFVAGGSPSRNMTSGHNSQTVGAIEPDVAAAAAAAFAAMTKAKEQGSLIDQELLIQILSNPLLVETLSGGKPRKNFISQSRVFATKCSSGTSVVNAATDSQANTNIHSSIKTIPTTTKKQPNSTISVVPPGFGISMQAKEVFDKDEVLLSKPPGPGNIALANSGAFGNGDINIQQPNGNTNLPFQSINSQTAMTSTVELRQLTNHLQLQPAGSAPILSLAGRSSTQYDEQYYKRLIMQHGGNKIDKALSWKIDTIQREAEPQRERLGINTGDSSRVKSRKVCAYYNTPRGCRNGVSCMFLHDASQDGAPAERTGFDIPQLHLKKKLRFENFT
ncbi:hypothetical protein O6H91_20G072200 [Diphasiastrum complanatum]|nr:hypothetical protein O6H91_20G072200 [Diphasiastrum complanatum]